MTAHGFRDLELEAQVLELTRDFGIGAQFGGRYFCHDVRVVRLPRHGASCPVAIAVSCSADRQALAKITPSGVFLEQLETRPGPVPAATSPTSTSSSDGDVVRIDLNRPMAEIRAELSRYPVKTRLSLTGPLVVARDIAHAKIAERLDAGEQMPQYLRDHAVYYAGPAKTPDGYASGSFGPTTAGRMDAYVEQFQAAGGSLVMLAKGNRSKQVTDACAQHGGFYLGSIGGPAARLAQDCIKKVEVLEYPELGMEAVWRIEVEDFPAFIVVDDKGNDFFAEVTKPVLTIGSRTLDPGRFRGSRRTACAGGRSATRGRTRASGRAGVLYVAVNGHRLRPRFAACSPFWVIMWQLRGCGMPTVALVRSRFGPWSSGSNTTPWARYGYPPTPCGERRPSARSRTSRSPAGAWSAAHIAALARIKAAAAQVNAELGVVARRSPTRSSPPRRESPPASSTTISRSMCSRPVPARRRT